MSNYRTSTPEFKARAVLDPHLSTLRNHIDIKRGPFSDRGSRLLVFQAPGRSRLLVKLAERLTELQPVTPI